MPDAGIDGAVDKGDLGLGRQDRRLVLQPVARTDLDQRHETTHFHLLACLARKDRSRRNLRPAADLLRALVM
jgi:hypothetical protein